MSIFTRITSKVHRTTPKSEPLPLMHFWYARPGKPGVVGVTARDAGTALVELRAETSALWAREAMLIDVTEIKIIP